VSWRSNIERPVDVLEKDFVELEPEFQDTVLGHRSRLREYFEENNEKDVPRHPYKIYSELRKKEGTYKINKTFADKRILAIEWALNYLKEEFEEKWNKKLENSS